MQSTFFPIIVSVVFLIFGLALLLLPFDVLRRYDRGTGITLINRAPDEQTGLRRARWLYRLMGMAFICVAALNSTAFWPSLSGFNGSNIEAPTVTYVDWLWSLSVRETDQGSPSPAQTTPVFPKNTKQVFVAFFTPSLANRELHYQWTVNNNPIKEFDVQEQNGGNFIELSMSDQSGLPSGKHNVLISFNGSRAAEARFIVE